MRRKPAVFLAAILTVPILTLPLGAAAAADPGSISRTLDIPQSQVQSISRVGESQSILQTSTPLGTFPRSGDDYLILSTGVAADVLGGLPEDFISTDLGNSDGVDGNDLTQVSIELEPPVAATCLAFDFQFLSEEYPDFVGSDYNDIFTAELNESYFTMTGDQVVAPNNFAYDGSGNIISINTVLGMEPATGTPMNGWTEPLVAITPVQRDLFTDRITVILTVQDIGDSSYDSAVLVDNFRWLLGAGCERTVDTLVDTDGDGLPDSWETNGIDYDADGTPEVDLPALGADPMRADIFVHVDWMVKEPTCLWKLCWGGRDFRPQQAALEDVVKAFADAPFENPDGSTGIDLHIQMGSPVPWSETVLDITDEMYDWTRLDELKEEQLDPLLRDVYHYALYADTLTPNSGSSGVSRGIPGADFLLTDGHRGWEGGFTRIQERGTFMHELGHNLGLMHGGVDHETYQGDPAYRSIMNYEYQLTGVGSTGKLDYSRSAPHDDWSALVFNGGSIGDLGESAPVVLTEILHEMTAEDAEPVDGDGFIEFNGPTVAGIEETTQPLYVTVHNRGESDTNYDVQISAPNGELIGTQTITVAGGQTSTVEVKITTAGLPLGPTELSLSLISQTLDDLAATNTASVTIVDPNDPATRADAEAALAELGTVDHALPQQVVDTVQSMFVDATDTDEETAPGTDEETAPGDDTTGTEVDPELSDPDTQAPGSQDVSAPGSAAEEAATGVIPITGTGDIGTCLLLAGAFLLIGVTWVLAVRVRSRRSS